MGTSNSNKGTRGTGTPLIPTWLDSDGAASGPSNPADAAGIPTGIAPVEPAPLPPAADSDRFTAPRSNFTRFARSGGNDRASLGRAVSGYVSRSLGGSRNAARSMGGARRATTQLLGFLTDAAARGPREALRSLRLESLVGRPIEEIFVGLADYVCPEGGTDDVGIAREAFFETIVELAESGVTDLDALTADQIQTVLELYATRIIEVRLYNDIGMKVIGLPETPAAVERVLSQLRDFIRNAVSDALTAMRNEMATLSTTQVGAFVDGVYRRAYDILVVMASAAAEPQ